MLFCTTAARLDLETQENKQEVSSDERCSDSKQVGIVAERQKSGKNKQCLRDCFMTLNLKATGDIFSVR